MWGYRAVEVAKMLGLSVGQVRSYVRSGFLSARRGPRGELRFSFQDLVLLRTARGLLAAEMPARRVKRALRKLKEQLPEGKELAGVHITADGDRIVVREGGSMWQPESGQVLFDFGVAQLAEKIAPLVRKAAKADDDELTAEDWYAWGCDLEDAAPEQAQDAYLRVLELEPDHVDAHVNLGRLLHAAGELDGAQEHYQAALARRPYDTIAAFNLGVALEDAGKHDAAIAQYELTLQLDPACADAHYNAARLLERLGRWAEALRHLGAYRKLIRE
jgi:tetratricopeptide (TPR) repeat protein